MTPDEYKPRFSFEITETQRLRSSRVFSNYGLRKAIFSKILDDVLDLVEEKGAIALGILMSPDLKPREILPSMAEVEQQVNKNG